ncbi:type 1 glutamine amidotransferase [Persicimonas caeni]|uniref:Type 1 glutamine amidotransferase n=1 Tax=Persicimonas caeni TaxID=2292766 RepID=A0A4Y6PR91_PERCE|nr:type 1 glutamine amidotransferase [Persicimonas caeni]QDG50305.1 type 1 glutamine amidotransferase [Persicimonas caeni]QED31526.1 type 1 glutamine amidotransferase [Persicimonas caeni]
MSGRTPKILLFQAREPGDPMLDHELRCFAERCELSPDAFVSVNMAEADLSSELLEGPDAVMVGGAGEYSVVEGGFDWHESMLELMRAVARKRMPMFASCFGFQALVQAFGGTVETVSHMSKLGTYEVTLTDAGRRDPIFGAHPDTFDAQFGHNDSATELPDELVLLARSERCPHQAVRFQDAPIVATQFHPELCAQDNIERYIAYLQNYEAAAISREQAEEKALQMHRPSPHASHLLREFVKELLA